MRIETKWAIVPSVIILLWLLLAQALGLFTAENFGMANTISVVISTLTFAFTYFMVTKEKRDREYNGAMTWSEGFWAAARMTLIYIPISSFVLYFYIQYLNPGYKAFIVSDDFGKDPINTFLKGNLVSSLLFGGLFCLVFPLFTRRSVEQKL